MLCLLAVAGSACADRSATPPSGRMEVGGAIGPAAGASSAPPDAPDEAGLDAPPPVEATPPAPDVAAVDGSPDGLVETPGPDAPVEADDDGSAGAGDADVAPEAGPPPPRDDAVLPGWRWDRKARRVIDRSTLPAAFRAAGYTLPEGAAVYAVRIVTGVEGPAYVLYEAGAGAFDQDFWPASTVKLLAALGALDFVRSVGFTGAAQVTFDDGTSDTVRAIIDRAIRVSSNADYDLTMLVAGLDRLNDEFLTAERGFPTVVLQRSYTGNGVRDSPGLTLLEGERTLRVEPRRGRADYGCPDNGNCTSLFDLVEGLRRVMLHVELPPAERFDIDPADRAALLDALCNDEDSSFRDGARAAFGTEPRVCHKTGSVHDRDYLDHALIEDPRTGSRFLLAASLPDQGGSTESRDALGVLAEHVLRTLAHRTSGAPLQPDAGLPLAVQLDRQGTGRHSRALLTIDAPGADAVETYLDGRREEPSAEGSRFVIRPRGRPRGEHLLVVVGLAGGRAVAYRAVRLRFDAAAAE